MTHRTAALRVTGQLWVGRLFSAAAGANYKSALDGSATSCLMTAAAEDSRAPFCIGQVTPIAKRADEADDFAYQGALLTREWG